MSCGGWNTHYSDVIIRAMASRITSLTIVYSTVHSGADQRKHQSSASLAFVRWIHWWPVNSPHKWPVTQKMFPFDDVIIYFIYAAVTTIPLATGITKAMIFRLRWWQYTYGELVLITDCKNNDNGYWLDVISLRSTVSNFIAEIRDLYY